MSKHSDISTYLTADEQKLWKKSTVLANTSVREPDINSFYKKEIVQLIAYDGFDYHTYDEDDIPSPVNLDQEQVESIATYAANGYSIRLYVEDDKIKAEAIKSYLDDSAYDIALREYNRMVPAKEQARKDIERLNNLIQYRKELSVVTPVTDQATIELLARKALKAK